jgi:hypothetical protein
MSISDQSFTISNRNKADSSPPDLRKDEVLPMNLDSRGPYEMRG